MIDELQQKAGAKNWPNIETTILDCRNLSSLADGTFTHVFSNSGGPLPDDTGSAFKGVKEAFRVLKVGRVLAMSTWNGELLVKAARSFLTRS